MFKVFLTVLLLSGCASTPPTPFVIGEETSPPRGCTEGRDRGVDC